MHTPVIRGDALVTGQGDTALAPHRRGHFVSRRLRLVILLAMRESRHEERFRAYPCSHDGVVSYIAGRVVQVRRVKTMMRLAARKAGPLARRVAGTGRT